MDDLRTSVSRALLEWRDAGGNVEDVVQQIEDMIREIVLEALDDSE